MVFFANFCWQYIFSFCITIWRFHRWSPLPQTMLRLSAHSNTAKTQTFFVHATSLTILIVCPPFVLVCLRLFFFFSLSFSFFFIFSFAIMWYLRSSLGISTFGLFFTANIYSISYPWTGQPLLSQIFKSFDRHFSIAIALKSLSLIFYEDFVVSLFC